MDGWEAVRKIRKEAAPKHQAPIYAMTAGMLVGKEIQDFTGILIKPFTLKQLEGVLSHHVRRQVSST